MIAIQFLLIVIAAAMLFGLASGFASEIARVLLSKYLKKK